MKSSQSVFFPPTIKTRDFNSLVHWKHRKSGEKRSERMMQVTRPKLSNIQAVFERQTKSLVSSEVSWGRPNLRTVSQMFGMGFGIFLPTLPLVHVDIVSIIVGRFNQSIHGESIVGLNWHAEHLYILSLIIHIFDKPSDGVSTRLVKKMHLHPWKLRWKPKIRGL